MLKLRDHSIKLIIIINLAIKLKIDFTKFELCQPQSLIFDENLNIYLTVARIDNNHPIPNKRLLCKLNSGGDLNDCKEINPPNLPNDLFILEKSLIIINENANEILVIKLFSSISN